MTFLRVACLTIAESKYDKTEIITHRSDHETSTPSCFLSIPLPKKHRCKSRAGAHPRAPTRLVWLCPPVPRSCPLHFFLCPTTASPENGACQRVARAGSMRQASVVRLDRLGAESRREGRHLVVGIWPTALQRAAHHRLRYHHTAACCDDWGRFTTLQIRTARRRPSRVGCGGEMVFCLRGRPGLSRAYLLWRDSVTIPRRGTSRGVSSEVLVLCGGFCFLSGLVLQGQRQRVRASCSQCPASVGRGKYRFGLSLRTRLAVFEKRPCWNPPGRVG